MAEALLFGVAQAILLKLGSYAAQPIVLTLGAKDELNKLERTMTTIKNVLLDAEEKQVTNPAVKDWMQRLKDLLYDIDDLLDEFATEALLRQVKTRGSKMKKVRYLFTRSNPLIVWYNIGRKTKDIRKKLDEVAKDMADFGFVVRFDRPFEFRRRETASVPDSNVFGRDNDKENLIKMLIRANSKELIVLPVVGMGGLGKTTLAQLVYNDKRVINHFKRRIWVCVSDNFNINTIITNILRVAGDNTVEERFGLERLQQLLREVLDGGKFFIVLDDVWNEDRVKWAELRNLLMECGSRSAILVTTRTEIVASKMRENCNSYVVKGLSNEDCLSVLLKWAFKGRSFENHGNLVNIGREIARKCGGVPLAARSLGCLLDTETDESDWCRVRDSEIWTIVQGENDIIPVLKLSYDQLSCSLKHCIAYCSVFQKDALINKWQLIYLWSAQGFITPIPNEELEVTGERYLNELVMRSFLEKVEDVKNERDLDDRYIKELMDYFFKKTNDLANAKADLDDRYVDVLMDSIFEKFVEDLANAEGETPLFKKFEDLEIAEGDCYRMHDLFHDLALSVAGSEFFCLKRGAEVIPNGIRHVSVAKEFCNTPEEAEPLKALLEGNKTRTILVRGDNLELKNIFKFRHLRAFYTNFQSQEESSLIFNGSKHLRYLDLHKPYIDVKEDSITRLVNLQYLNFRLFFFNLPKNFRNLVNLRYLSIHSEKPEILPEEEIVSLISLRVLIVKGKILKFPEEIHRLTFLRVLEIKRCFKLTSLPLGFRRLSSLEHLSFIFCANLEILNDDLQGLRSLKSLKLDSLNKLLRLPEGLHIDTAASLRHFKIRNCIRMESMSLSFAEFTSLKKLEILNCLKLSSLPEGMESLTTLQSVTIKNCRHLLSRCKEGGEDWAKISRVPHLDIDNEW